MRVIMGIDPGLANTGFGVLRVAGGQIIALDGGVIESTPDEPVPQRLKRIADGLSELIGWHSPEALALEDLYFGRNARSAMAVGQGRGVAMLSAAQHDVPCFDYTPQAIKLSVCGSGAADKRQVQRMVGTLLGLPRPPESDHTADALAVAICHASHAPAARAAAAVPVTGARAAVGGAP